MKIGDIVVLIKPAIEFEIGDRGTITGISPSGKAVYVSFDGEKSIVLMNDYVEPEINHNDIMIDRQTFRPEDTPDEFLRAIEKELELPLSC